MYDAQAADAVDADAAENSDAGDEASADQAAVDQDDAAANATDAESANATAADDVAVDDGAASDEQSAAQQNEAATTSLSSDEAPAETGEEATDNAAAVGPSEDMPNSWRYDNGTLRTDVDPGISLFSMDALPEGATAQGIDVSQWNGTIDWAQVKAAGIDFAILRIGYGSSGVDSRFAANVKGCQDNDIPFGVYVYCYAWDAASARSEAEGTLARLRSAGVSSSDLSLPVYYDMENEYRPQNEDGTDNTSDPRFGDPAGVDGQNQYRFIEGGAQTFAEMASTFASVLQDSGYGVGIYANLNWWNNYLTDPAFSQWDRWVAQYKTACSYEGEYSAWQYTASGSVPGINGAVDMNWWYGTPSTDGVGVSADFKGTRLSMSMSGFSVQPSNVAFEVRGPSGSVAWYQAERQGDGSWSFEADVVSKLGWGDFVIYGWATFGPVTDAYGSATASAHAGDVSVSASVSGGALSLSASGWSVAPSNVAFEVKAPSGASRWYQAERRDDGSWSYSAAVGSDFGEPGSYTVNAWATVGGATSKMGDSATAKLSAGDASVSASVSGGTLALSVSGWSLSPANVAFEVKAPSGASRWYQAKSKGGSWSCTAAVGSDLGEWGEYTAVAWATFGPTTSSQGSAKASLGSVSLFYSVRRAYGGWAEASNGAQASTWNGSSVEGANALSVKVQSSPVTGPVVYQGYIAGNGWLPQGADGKDVGPTASGACFSAIRVSPTGNLASYCDIWYRVYVSDYGWLGWAKNGQTAGTTNLSLRVESVQMVAKPKGSAAPGSTANAQMTEHRYIGFQNPPRYPQVSHKTVKLPSYCTGEFTYVSPSRISYKATRNDCVNAFITRAYEYLGTRYIEPYSTAPGGAVDCSGLVMQCLYATGMDLGWYNPYNHRWLPEQTYNSMNWYRNNTFMPVSVSSIKRGDVVYYSGHIAIYLGNNQIIDSWPGNGVSIKSISSRGRVIGAARPYVG